jgi:hypothetical protein
MLRMCVTVRADVSGVAKLSQTASRKGGKAVKKGDLPIKTCVECGLPITWRKKWERCWDEISYACAYAKAKLSQPWPSVSHARHDAGIVASGAATRASASVNLRSLQASL